MAVVDHCLVAGRPVPAAAQEGLAIALRVRDYSLTQARREAARREAAQRGRVAGFDAVDVATELDLDPRSLRARPAAKTRPANAHLWDRMALGISEPDRLDLAYALGLLDHRGAWRLRVLAAVARLGRS